jgi:hypothetical protein
MKNHAVKNIGGLLFVLVFAGAAVSLAQPAQFKIPITFTAASGPPHSITIRFGVSGDGPGGVIPDNTYGVDLGSQFGAYEEFSLPPPPPTPIFDVRFKDIPSRGFPPFPLGLDTGVEGDYRGFLSSSQIDSYLVALDGTDLESNPLIVSWPGNLGNHGTGWILKSALDLFPSVDMLSTTSATISGQLAGAGSLLIIKTGASGTTAVEPATGGLPLTFALEQNFPNPFNPSTTIRFRVSSADHVSLKVFDVLGREAESLVNERLQPGRYEVVWNARGMASGAYLCTLRAGSFFAARTLMLMR